MTPLLLFLWNKMRVIQTIVGNSEHNGETLSRGSANENCLIEIVPPEPMSAIVSAFRSQRARWTLCSDGLNLGNLFCTIEEKEGSVKRWACKGGCVFVLLN
ncbi:hypothetical protein NPIL_585991 [Nephila pilipes]|uniref:Uncharacterized protein n=1 Tax=Nephila pilipes TaxID=299642 RepID=A0A8X6P9R0_NEPPI|nr:hypothetical protein NPIL_585991 [Nephila pilipes]